MKKHHLFLSIILLFSLNSCVTLKEPNVIMKGNLHDYQYVVINPTQSLTSSVGTTINGIYVSEGKTVNPGDVISGYLIKNGFIVLPEIQEDKKSNTMIITYGESGRRTVFWGYTTEVTLQFISADNHSLICTSTAEGIGDTEADDIKKAIIRALDAIF